MHLQLSLPFVVVILYRLLSGWYFADPISRSKGVTQKRDNLVYHRSCTKNKTLPNTWCLDTTQVPHYIGDRNFNNSDNITITRYNYEGFMHCLTKKTIVFIGDSRVRYQYMHLVNYLTERRFMKCQDYGIEPERGCYLIDHKHHQRMNAQSWNDWYKKSTLMLGLQNNNSNFSQSQSLCDCYRPGKFRPHTTYENRFVQLNGVEINLVYLQNFQNQVRLNTAYPPFSSFSAADDRCKPGECGDINRTNAFDGDTNATLWEILPRLNTTHALINLGWEHLFPLQAQSDFTCRMEDFMLMHPNIKLHLISHPTERRFASQNVLQWFDRSKLRCNVEVLDRSILSQGVPPTWYWDNMHPLSILNEEYNNRLIEMICPLPSVGTHD